MPKKVAYIMSRFPHLPETFILREMIAVEKEGVEVVLYPLIYQHQALVHQEARSWIQRVNKVPWLSWEVFVANLRRAFFQPGLFFSLWSRVLWENRESIKFLARVLILFPRAVWMADKFQVEGVDHIHAHYATHPAFAAWLINQLSGIPYSVTVHAHDIFVEKTMLDTKLRGAAFVAAISEFNREYLVRFLGEWVRRKVHIVRCGIDPNYYKVQEKILSNNKVFEILSIGSLQPYKGQVFLIKACALLRDLNLDFRCRIVGGGHLQRMLSDLIVENELEGIVELLGPRTQDEVSKILETADCYVQPSVVTPSGKMEGIPVALMEAMASGIPVIATSISGIPELVQEGITGWLVPPESPDALANAIRFVHENTEEARKRSLAGRELVNRDFCLDDNVSKLVTLFLGNNLIN